MKNRDFVECCLCGVVSAFLKTKRVVLPYFFSCVCFCKISPFPVFLCLIIRTLINEINWIREEGAPFRPRRMLEVWENTIDNLFFHPVICWNRISRQGKDWLILPGSRSSAAVTMIPTVSEIRKNLTAKVVMMNKTEPGTMGVTSDFDRETTCKYFLYRTLGSDDQLSVESGFKVRIWTLTLKV